MICKQCNFNNESGSRFCANCGDELKNDISQTSKDTIENTKTLICPSCRENNPLENLFCGNCGASLVPQPTERRNQIVASSQKQTSSAAWWIMPILLAWVGGLIGWLVVREYDNRKAKKLLWTGVGITFAWFMLAIIGNLAPYFFLYG
jgi:hypothetical protein